MFGKDWYRQSFDSLVRAFRLVCYNQGKDVRYTAINRQLREVESKIVAAIIERIQQLGGAVVRDPATEVLEINSEFTATVTIARFRHWHRPRGVHWFIPEDCLKADVAIIVRMDVENRKPRDYYILPRCDMTTQDLMLRERNGVRMDAYRFSNLDSFFAMIPRVKAEEAT